MIRDTESLYYRERRYSRSSLVDSNALLTNPLVCFARCLVAFAFERSLSDVISLVKIRQNDRFMNFRNIERQPRNSRTLKSQGRLEYKSPGVKIKRAQSIPGLKFPHSRVIVVHSEIRRNPFLTRRNNVSPSLSVPFYLPRLFFERGLSRVLSSMTDSISARRINSVVAATRNYRYNYLLREDTEGD